QHKVGLRRVAGGNRPAHGAPRRPARSRPAEAGAAVAETSFGHLAIGNAEPQPPFLQRTAPPITRLRGSPIPAQSEDSLRAKSARSPRPAHSKLRCRKGKQREKFQDQTQKD